MKRWLSAMRLRTLPLAASCVLAGGAYGWSYSSHPGLIFTFALITTFLLQILSNLANDYGDFESGVDNEKRVGPARAMQSGAITKTEMKKALILCSSLALLSGIVLLFVAFREQHMFSTAIIFLLIGLLAIVAAIKYTVGSKPYGYSGLGDIAVFVFFGLVGVFGNYFLYSHSLDKQVLFAAMAIGLFSTSVLNLNNLRDHINDKSSGKITVVVRLGFENGKIYHLLLVVLAAIAATIGVLNHDGNVYSFLPMLPVAIQLVLLIKVIKTKNPADLDSELKKVAILTFLYGILLFLTSVMS